jgi:methionyl-tRNA formyltransferase
MRVAYFTTSGKLALAPLQALIASGCDVVLVVRPAAGRLRSWVGGAARRLGLLGGDPVADLARDRGIALCRARERGDPGVVRALGRARVDLLCVSTFRWVLPREILELARLGGINLHSSLLPRHRGPLPLFWTYHGDDREAGVSVHRLAARADAGDLLLQDRAPLERGYPVERLDEENAARGAALLARSVDAIAEGSARGTPQRETEATYAPLLLAGASMVDFESWNAERVWHFLAGLLPRYREPLRDTTGHAVRYAAVTGHEPSAASAPAGVARGRVERHGDHGALRCRDGWVQLRLMP